MLPSQQAFQRDQLAGNGWYNSLIVETELVPIETRLNSL